MNVERGQITCVALIIAVIAAGMGGFLLNAHDITATHTDYEYVTDVYGAFHGSDQDLPVDFNPRENVTGYYAKDPVVEPAYTSIAVPSINYTPSQNGQGEQMPNNYPYTNTRMAVEYYDMELEFTRGHDTESNATYHVKITNMTQGSEKYGHVSQFDFTSTFDMSSKFFIDRSQLHLPDIYHWYVSTTQVGSATHDTGCIVNLAELINRQADLKNKHITFESVSDSMYPTFGAMINYRTYDTPGVPSWVIPSPVPITIGGTTWYNFSFEDTQRIVTASTETSSLNIHGVDYPLSDGWLAWGGIISQDHYDTKITMHLSASTPDESMRYIDPNYGVAPQSTFGAAKEIVSVPYFSDEVKGKIQLDEQPFYDKTEYTARIWVTIGDENENWDRIPLAVIYLAGLAFGDEWNHLKVWQVDGDGNYDVDNPTLDVQTFTGEKVHKYISWYTSDDDILRGSWYAEETGSEQGGEWSVPIPKTLKHDGKIQIKDMQIELLGWDPSSETSWKTETLTMDCEFGDLHKTISWKTYEQAPSVDPDTPYQPGSSAIQTWAYVEEEHTVTYESEITFWYNGYANSKIGQIFSTKEIVNNRYLQTKLNLKLHVQENSDYWVYGDASKMSVIIYADGYGMVHIGGLDANGQVIQTKQLGNCSYVYVQFTVENERVHMYQGPIYQFTNFMNYTMPPIIDCTDCLAPVYKDSQCKSISQMSYYVPFQRTDDDPTRTWMPRQLVVNTTILLDAGGLYIQDGELNLNVQFPQYPISEFVINAVVHPGKSMSLISNGNVLLTIENDGVDKWIYNKQYYDWWDIKIYYAGNGEGIWTEGKQLPGHHVYIQQGKYSPLEDVGELTDDDFTIKMDGVWAFSTQYYNGETSTTTTIEFDDPGTWHWSKEEFMVVFLGVLALASAIMYFRFGFNALDLIVFGGQAALIWVMF